jgi:hypothetical protein
VAHILRDFFTGGAIMLGAAVCSLIALLVFLVCWIFFHVLGFLVLVFLFIFLFFAAVWLTGFLYRKMREGRK